MSAMSRNDGFEYSERIGPGADGLTLLAYLSRNYRHSSVQEWTSRIESGLVLVDSLPARPETLVQRGQTLIWSRPPWDEPDGPGGFAVIFQDADLLGVAKPAGMPTLPGAGFLHGTLLHEVGAYAPGAVPLHRLGRWTSGVVLFARTPAARVEMSRQWAAREVGKRYRALAEGAPAWDEITVSTPIGPVSHALLGTVHAADAAGKDASTHVAVVERRDRSFLCDVHIATGRPHQIRIHLAAAGHPLVGDPLYLRGGAPAPGTHAVPGDPGYHLHAAELTFRHPRSGRGSSIECAPPLVLRNSIR